MANKNERKIRIPEDVEEFADVKLKSFKKDSKGYYSSKKEAKESYYLYLIDLLPETIEFIVRFGHVNNRKVQETKAAVLKKIADPDFVKVLTKRIKKGDEIKKIKLLPIILREMLLAAKRENDARLAEDPNAKCFDISDLVELSKLILKKRIKKLEKEGISQGLAFDILTVFPCSAAFESSQFYRMRTFYETLYEHAKTTKIDVPVIMKNVVKEENYKAFIVFALLERKEKFSRLTDSQKTLYLNISNWCFDVMDKEMKKGEIFDTLSMYVNARERDDKAGKDSNRRCNLLSSISEDEYKRLYAALQNVARDDSKKKYL